MLRSLSSAISGLQNHQTRMDIVGNNISNVNTTGYKSGRVTFEESYTQLLQGASRPPGESGGTNPLQVGMGMGVGSVDTMTGQGNLKSTGRVLDLAIQGGAYFGVSDGKATFYSRNGGFQLDSGGYLVLPTNGMVLQGKMADSRGEFPAGTVVGDIRIPFNEQSPAQVTENVSFSRNLDSESDAKGSVIYSQRFLHHAQEGDDIRAVFNSKGGDLGIKEGDQITITVTDAGGNTTTQTYVTGTQQNPRDIQSLRDLMDRVADFVAGGNGSAVSIADGTTGHIGAVAIVPDQNYSNLQITSNNPLSNAFLNKAFNVPSSLQAGTTYYTDALRAPAEGGDPADPASGDLLAELYDSAGNRLGLEDGDQINVTGMVGKDSVNSASDNLTIAYSSDPAVGTRMSSILQMARDSLKLPEKDGTVQNNVTVSMNTGGSDDGIPDGSMVIRGAKGSAFSFSNITIRANNSDNDDTTPTLFNANTAFTTKQQAKDVGQFDTSITVYDNTGEEHVMTMRYIHSGTPNVWNWEASFSGKEEILKGGSGQITFGQDGSVAAFTFKDNASQLTVEPYNGANPLYINLDVGGPGNFQGITQFSSPTTVSAVKQDGYTTGSLQDISIDEQGFISGSFSNGTSHRLAQIMLVDFTNPGGLMRISDSVYSISSNSGDPIYGAPGTQSSSTIKPGALEMSNVDLASEFTEMITTQRGYQANARVITVSDTMLEELVALKR